MAFSGSKNFSVSRNDIITLALRKIGVADAADGPAAVEITAAALTLNTLVKEWTGEGLGLWLALCHRQQRRDVVTHRQQPRTGFTRRNAGCLTEITSMNS
jgi:hypothetical protein